MIYVIFGILLVAAMMGVLLGMVFYFKPDIIVSRRMKKMNVPVDDTDPEFQKALSKEYAMQIVRTKKIGKLVLIFELMWVLIIIFLFSGNLTNR